MPNTPYGDEQANTPPRRSPIHFSSRGNSRNSSRSASPIYREGRQSPSFMNQSSASSNYDNSPLNPFSGLEREDDEFPLRRSHSKENVGPCDEIDRRGRFTNLPSNWQKSLQFFEEKREELPIQHVKVI